MKSFFSLVLVFLMTVSVFSLFPLKPIEAQTVNTGDFDTSEIVVILKDGYTINDLRKKTRLNDINLTQSLPNSNLVIVKLTDSKLKELGVTKRNSIDKNQKGFNRSKYFELIQDLQSDPSVLIAEPNYVYYLPDQSTKEEFSEDTITHIQTDTASNKIVVAVVDTEINGNHPAISSRIYRKAGKVVGYDFVNNDKNPFNSGATHATAVAGIIAGITNTANGFKGGTCGDTCVIMPLAVCSQGICSSGHIFSAIEFAATNGARVVNMSFGGSSSGMSMGYLIGKYFKEKGIVFVAAAGNDGGTKKFYPAADMNVVSVGALVGNSYRAPFSNYGSWVDIGAPGMNVKTIGTGTSYTSQSGTSVAAPHVSGTIARFLYSQPAHIAYLVEKIILVDGHKDYANNVPSVGKGISNLSKMRNSTVLSDKMLYPTRQINAIHLRPYTFKWIVSENNNLQRYLFRITNKEKTNTLYAEYFQTGDGKLECSIDISTCILKLGLSYLDLPLTSMTRYNWEVIPVDENNQPTESARDLLQYQVWFKGINIQ